MQSLLSDLGYTICNFVKFLATARECIFQISEVSTGLAALQIKLVIQNILIHLAENEITCC